MERWLLVALALAARVPGIGRGPWYDERFTLRHFADSLPHALARQVQANNHPLASVLAWAAGTLLGTSVPALRLPSLVLGALGAVALARWVSARAGRGAGAAAGLLAVVHPAHVAWSQEVRGYAVVLALVPVVAWLAHEVEKGRRSPAVLGFAVALLLWGHLTAGVLVLGLALSSARAPRVLAGLSGGAVGAGLLLAPTLSHVGPFASRNVALDPPSSERVEAVLALLLTGDARLFSPEVGLAVGVALLALALAGAVASWRARDGIAPPCVATLGVTVLLWVAARPLFHARFFLFLLPLVLALAGRGAAALGRGRRAVLVVAPLVVALAVATGRRASLENEPIAPALAQMQGSPFAVVGLGAELVEGGVPLSGLLAEGGPRRIGVVVLYPERVEAREAMQRCERAGFRVVGTERLEGLQSDVLVVRLARE